MSRELIESGNREELVGPLRVTVMKDYETGTYLSVYVWEPQEKEWTERPEPEGELLYSKGVVLRAHEGAVQADNDADLYTDDKGNLYSDLDEVFPGHGT